MKRVFIIAIFSMGMITSGTALAQPLPKVWQDWVAQSTPLVHEKEQGIRSAIDYRAQVCQYQAPENKTDCENKFQEIIDRRVKERNLLSGELHVLKMLPTDEATEVTAAANVVYVQKVEETNEKLKQALEKYPRKQASK